MVGSCSTSTQRGKRAQAEVQAEVPRVQPWARRKQACPSLGLRCRASAASSQPCERQSGAGWFRTNGLSSRLGAKWPPRTRFTTGPKHKGKENPALRPVALLPANPKGAHSFVTGFEPPGAPGAGGSIVPLFSVCKQPRKELSQPPLQSGVALDRAMCTLFGNCLRCMVDV